MGRLRLDTESKPTAPSAGQSLVFVNNTTKRIQTLDDAGFSRTLGYVNFSKAAQSPTAATRTYITGSNIAIPAGALQVGTMFRWAVSMTKTAAGIAASTFDICFGTAGTTADTARVSFTKPAGTAAVDEGMVIITAICRGPVGASGVVAGTFEMTHNGNTAGHATTPTVNLVTVSSAFDITTPTNIGICLTSGAADAITIQVVTAETWNL